VPWPRSCCTPATRSWPWTPSSPQAQGCFPLQLDISDSQAVSRLPALLAELGLPHVNVLVNNAGLADPYQDQSAPAAQQIRTFDRYVAVNLCGERLGSALFVMGAGC
jgi:NAD(P)-dependent dehydrogenase (short-subunit alcohol dehydrogenase family)